MLQGTIDLVTYHDPGSLYSVLRLCPEGGYESPADALFQPERLTAVGRTPDPAPGIRVRLVGTWERHKAHGLQFAFESLEPLAPIDRAGLVRYLASKAFDGIGETLARRIVDKLGEETLEVIRDHPERLDGIRGLRGEVARNLASSVRAQLAAHRTHAFLMGLGLGPVRSRSVIAKLGPECEAAVRENPYCLASVPGLGFASADRVAVELGLDRDDPRRLAAGLIHALGVAADDGNTTVPLAELARRASELLGMQTPEERLRQTLAELERARAIVIDRTLLELEDEYDGRRLAYLPWLNTSEVGLARNLVALLESGPSHPLADAERLARAERETGLVLHPDQRSAVVELLSSPVGLLTGGPGVGKTTIVRLVARLAEAAGARVLLASPTGRAAKRLAEASGRDASTVHRLLGYQPAGGSFQHDAEHPLKAGLVIIDEISMLDVTLAHHLLKAIRPPTRLVLVGDPDQLPSVGPGNVLRDLIDSQRIPVARLTRIFRQDEASRIVSNAHRILSGAMPVLPERGDLASDFYFFPADDPVACRTLLVDVVARRVPETFGFDWVRDVQVIAPMYRGECGVDALNETLREALGYGGREVTLGRRTWRIGDRVIHTRNDYEKEIFNGDMGQIIEVSSEGTLTVRYPEQSVVYTGSEVDDLRPAFAITVHRSQGGEFPVVVVPLVTQHYMMLQRNLLYTAITRARKLVVLVGSRRALQMAIDNDRRDERESALVERLRQLTREDGQ